MNFIGKLQGERRERIVLALTFWEAVDGYKVAI
jgi:hypothetical protein